MAMRTTGIKVEDSLHDAVAVQARHLGMTIQEAYGQALAGWLDKEQGEGQQESVTKRQRRYVGLLVRAIRENASIVGVVTKALDLADQELGPPKGSTGERKAND
jgi:hypothetical protein